MYLLRETAISEILFQTYKEKGSDYIEKNFNDLISGYRLQGPPSVVLNQLGYSLMMMERNIKDAIVIFTINTKLFPNDGNAFDSLAEAHLNYGNNKMAIKYYRKAIELNPDNVNAIEMLKQLKL